MSDVLLYVNYLLGIGHLQRAAVLTRAMDRRGLSVTVVRGGGEVPGIDFGSARLVELPAARVADEQFLELTDRNGRAVDEAWKKNRARMLVAALRDASPKVLLTEHFPFGRFLFEFELEPLMKTARTMGCHVLASVRDILVRTDPPEKVAIITSLVECLFDRVLVHGDAGVATLESSFPAAAAFRDKLLYTGYVVDERARHAVVPGSEILVAAGGGVVGERLLRTALEARRRSRYRDRPWRLLAGIHFPEAALASLRSQAGEGVTIERHRGDYLRLVRAAEVLVSQAGYNTLVEVVAQGVKAVVVPFVTDTETEQRDRARLFARRGLVRLVEEDPFTPDALAAAIDGAERPPADPGIDFDGAGCTASYLLSIVEKEAANRSCSVGYLDQASSLKSVQAYKASTFSYLRVRSGHQLLDLGCGTGDDAARLAERVGVAGRVVAVDRDPEMVAEARHRHAGQHLNLEFRVADGHELPFPDDTFDGCRADRALQHVGDPLRVLSELHRVGRPGARVVVCDPDWQTLLVDAEDRVLTRRVLANHHCCENPFIGRRLPALFRRAGLSGVTVAPFTGTVTSYALADRLFGLVSTARRARAASELTKREVDGWLDGLSRADDRGEFFSCLTLFVVCGRCREAEEVG